MSKKLIIIAMILGVFLGGKSYSQSFNGVYQLAIENQDGLVISKGTGFYIYSEDSNKSYIVTSFHLLNSRLLEASKIKITNIGSDMYLKIAAYDELNDVLVLYSKEKIGHPWSITDDCKGKISVVGFHNDKLLGVDVEAGLVDTDIETVKKLSVYLSKGFSGAPLFNDKAQICGMVALSSEQNASSIAVSSEIIKSVLATVGRDLYSVREIRIMLGVEKTVHTQYELDRVIEGSDNVRQMVIVLDPTDRNEKFLIKNTSNIIIEARTNINKLVIHRSSNVMVRNINAERLMINESRGVTVVGCIFDSLDQALLLKDSLNLDVKGNFFKGIDTGIVLKATSIDDKALYTDNTFVSVLNSIKKSDTYKYIKIEELNTS